jgi:hypothetical protein
MQETVIQDHPLVVYTKAGEGRAAGRGAPLRLQRQRMQQEGAQGVVGLGGHLVASAACKGARIGRVDLPAPAKGARVRQTGGGLADLHTSPAWDTGSVVVQHMCVCLLAGRPVCMCMSHQLVASVVHLQARSILTASLCEL